MADIGDIRRANLRLLITEHEGMNSLARKMGMTKGAYISQLLSNPPVRNLGERTARNFERKLSLPQGWMDEPHDAYGVKIPKIEGFSPELMKSEIVACMNALDAAHLPLDAERFAEMVVMRYQDDARSGGRVDQQKIASLVKLLKG